MSTKAKTTKTKAETTATEKATAKTAEPTVLSCAKTIQKSVQVRVEFPSELSDKDTKQSDFFQLDCASSDYTYFKGEHIALHIDGELAERYKEKDELLSAISGIFPFKTAEGTPVNPYDECIGVERVLPAYAPFSPELMPSESAVHIYIDGFVDKGDE